MRMPTSGTVCLTTPMTVLPCRRDQAKSVETARRQWWGRTGAPTGTRRLLALYLARRRWRDNIYQLASSRTRCTRSPSKSPHNTAITATASRNLDGNWRKIAALWNVTCTAFFVHYPAVSQVICSVESAPWTNSHDWFIWGRLEAVRHENLICLFERQLILCRGCGPVHDRVQEEYAKEVTNCKN